MPESVASTHNFSQRLQKLEQLVGDMPQLKAALEDIRSSLARLAQRDEEQATGLTRLAEQHASALREFRETLTSQRLEHREALQTQETRWREAQDRSEERWRQSHEKIVEETLASFQTMLIKGAAARVFSWGWAGFIAALVAGFGWLWHKVYP